MSSEVTPPPHARSAALRGCHDEPLLGEGFLANSGCMLALRGHRWAAKTSKPSHGACGSPSRAHLSGMVGPVPRTSAP